MHGPHVRNFTKICTRCSTTRTARSRSADAGKLAVRIGAWLKDSPARLSIATAARQTVDRLGGALDRTLTALEPYLMQLQIEHRTGAGLPDDNGMPPAEPLTPSPLRPNFAACSSSRGRVMREPRFWWRAGGAAAALLATVAVGYGAVSARRMARQGKRAGIPVLCVGNPTMGGAGKTPTAIRIRTTAERGRRQAVPAQPRLWRLPGRPGAGRRQGA